LKSIDFSSAGSILWNAGFATAPFDAADETVLATSAATATTSTAKNDAR
jgi:hypothetical protein